MKSPLIHIHKAAPGTDPYHCAVCGQRVRAVPGGQGTTYVHSDSGAVAAPNPPGVEVLWAPYQEFPFTPEEVLDMVPPDHPVIIMATSYRGNRVIIYWGREDGG